MNLQKYFAVIFLMCCMRFFEIRGYPTLNIRRLFDSSIDSRYKKSDFQLPQADEDVLELEHLKHSHLDGVIDNISEQLKEQHRQQQLQQDDSEMPMSVDVTEADSTKHYHSENTPDLERQLESATASSATLTVATVKPPRVDSVADHNEQEHAIQGAHRPPMLPLNDGGKTLNSNQQQADITAGGDPNVAGVPSMAKPFYGAARLAFGQNPEVLPTSSTTSTSTAVVTTTTSTTTTAAAAAAAATDISEDAEEPISQTHNSNKSVDETAEITATSTARIVVGQMPVHPIHPPNSELTVENKNEQNKESVGDVNVDELEATKSASRRSVTYLMTPKTAVGLLRHRDGQYSPFDMAQYVFWTGDEVGVARAVEELIEQGLMTRESALNFLRDIRVCIEYLQRSYSNRVLPHEINNVKKSFPTPTTTSTTTTTTTEKPFPHARLGLEGGRRNLHFQKALDSISMWNKLQEMNDDGRQELTDYNESAGRAKIAEFLYTEYTLEEILYNLAKVMFTQSLAHGSDEAQQELQKLTDFLEREGNRGIIPLDLQKKVLHVLLTALSDTLNERPELLPVARLNLGNSFNSFPAHTYGTLK